MEMDRALTITVIDEANNSFDATWYHNGGTRGGPIVSNKTSWFLARVDLGCERLDVELVVPYFLVGDWIDDFPASRQLGALQVVDVQATHCLTWATGGIGRAMEYSVYAGLSSPPFLAAARLVESSSTIPAKATASVWGISLAKRFGLAA